jgi:hypothetical protein
MKREETPIEWISRNSVDVMIGAVLVVGVFLGAFGMANWADQTYPSFPSRTNHTAEQYDQIVADYPRRVQSVGQNSVVALPYAVGMTFAGFAAAVVCLGTWLKRHG